MLVCWTKRSASAAFSGVAAVGLERLQERPDLGDVHPAQQVRVVGGVRPAELVLAAHPPVHRPHVRDGVLGVRTPCRTW